MWDDCTHTYIYRAKCGVLGGQSSARSRIKYLTMVSISKALNNGLSKDTGFYTIGQTLMLHLYQNVHTMDRCKCHCLHTVLLVDLD